MNGNNDMNDSSFNDNPFDGPPWLSGKNSAISSFVCGLIAVILEVFGFLNLIVIAVIGIALGIVSIILASSSSKSGYSGGLKTAGLVFGILGIVFGGLIFIEEATCTGCLCVTV